MQECQDLQVSRQLVAIQWPSLAQAASSRVQCVLLAGVSRPRAASERLSGLSGVMAAWAAQRPTLAQATNGAFSASCWSGCHVPALPVGLQHAVQWRLWFGFSCHSPASVCRRAVSAPAYATVSGAGGDARTGGSEMCFPPANPEIVSSISLCEFLISDPHSRGVAGTK